MIVNYTFYQSVTFTLSDHYIIDDIEVYLNNLEQLKASDTKTLGYILDVINVTFNGLDASNYNSVKPFNYLRVEYVFSDEKKIIHYYFVNNVVTSHEKIFTFNVTIDLLNTYANQLIFSPETFIERQHEKMFLQKYEYNNDYYFLRNIPKLVNFDFNIPELIAEQTDIYYLTVNENNLYKNFWLKVIFASDTYGLVSAFIPYDGLGFRIVNFDNTLINSCLNQINNIKSLFTNANVWSVTVIPYCPIKQLIAYNDGQEFFDLTNEPYFFPLTIDNVKFLAIKVLDSMEYYNNSFLPVGKSYVPLDYVYQAGTFYHLTDFIKEIYIEKINKFDYDARYQELIQRSIKEPVLFSSAFKRFVISNNDFNFELSHDDFEIITSLENIIRNLNQKAIKVEFLPYFSEEKSIGYLRVKDGDFFRLKTAYGFNVPVIYEMTLFNDKYRDYIDSGNFYVDKEILSNNLKQVSNNRQLFETSERFNKYHSYGNIVTNAAASIASFIPSPLGGYAIGRGIRGLNRVFGSALELVENSLTYDVRKEKFNLETINLELENRAKLNNYTFNRLSNKTVGNFELSYRRYEDFAFMFAEKDLHDDNLSKRIADIYYYYGSNVNQYGIPFHHARIRFDYLRCQPKFVNINLVANLGCLKLMEEFFRQGVTYIHHYNGEWVFPFQQIENVDVL